MNGIKYSYLINNLIDKSAALEKIRKIEGVINAEIENETLFITLDEAADEYEIMTASLSVVESLGGELIPEEGEGEKLSEQAAAEELKEDEIVDNELIGVDIKAIPYDEEDEKSPDRLRKKLKGDLLWRGVEIAASIVFFIVGIFLININQTAGILLSSVAFAISAYEILYDVFSDVAKKRFLSHNILFTIATIAAILLSAIIEVVAISIITAIVRYLSSAAERIAEYKLKETFYAGGGSYKKVNGEFVTADKIEVGNELTVAKNGTVPCDGIALTATEIDATRLKIGTMKIAAGDAVFAGSIALNGFEIKATKTNENSRLGLEKAAFDEKLSSVKPSEKENKIYNIVTISAIFAALIITFVLPIFSSSYSSGLTEYGQRGTAVLLICILSFGVNNFYSAIKRMFEAGRINSVELNTAEGAYKIASSKSFYLGKNSLVQKRVVSVASSAKYKGRLLKIASLCPDFLSGNATCESPIGKVSVLNRELAIRQGVKAVGDDDKNLYVLINDICEGFLVTETVVREDFSGMVKEFAFLGVNKVSCENPETKPSQEAVTVATEDCDIGFFKGGKLATVKVDEISFIPLTYKVSKGAMPKKLLNVFMALKVLFVLAAIFVPVAIIPAPYFAAIELCFPLFFAIKGLVTICKKY